jgi:hypothetical protein
MLEAQKLNSESRNYHKDRIELTAESHTITKVKAGRDSLQIMSVVPLPAQCQCFVPVNEPICCQKLQNSLDNACTITDN